MPGLLKKNRTEQNRSTATNCRRSNCLRGSTFLLSAIIKFFLSLTLSLFLSHSKSLITANLSPTLIGLLKCFGSNRTDKVNFLSRFGSRLNSKRQKTHLFSLKASFCGFGFSVSRFFSRIRSF